MQYQLIQADLGDVVTCDSIITSDGLYQIKKIFLLLCFSIPSITMSLLHHFPFSIMQEFTPYL